MMRLAYWLAGRRLKDGSHERRPPHAMSAFQKAILALLWFVLTSAYAASIGYFVDGNELKDRLAKKTGSRYQVGLGYVMGVHDAWNGSFCTPDGVTAGQLDAIVSKYLADNPKLLHLSADQLVIKALQDAFPCPRK